MWFPNSIVVQNMFCNIFIIVPCLLLHHCAYHLANFSETLHDTIKLNNIPHKSKGHNPQSLRPNHYAQHFTFKHFQSSLHYG
jgi:hypothetical protein